MHDLATATGRRVSARGAPGSQEWQTGQLDCQWRPTEAIVLKVLACVLLMVRVACQRLEVDLELCFRLWRTRPAIEVVLEDPGEAKRQLTARIESLLVIGDEREYGGW